MNTNWLDFLHTQDAVFLEDGTIQMTKNSIESNTGLYPISDLSILKVSGNDAEQFLQGQLTCNVNELTPDNSFFAAFCNAKGRTITTLLIVKSADDFLLILPTVLLEKVHKKLKMYVLRSAVQLVDASDEYCLSGLFCEDAKTNSELPTTDFARVNDIIKLSNSLYIMIASSENSIKRWTESLKEGVPAQNSQAWDYQTISAGLAWLDDDSSEEYIPQMLNIDKLGGISFDKGCYTGQEVVARTHYLGKAKRILFVAECSAEVSLESNSIINENNEKVGKIIKHQKLADKQGLLMVMQSSATEATSLNINNTERSEIKLKN